MNEEQHATAPDADGGADPDAALFALLNGHWEALQRGESTNPGHWVTTHPEDRDKLPHLRLVSQLYDALQMVRQDSSLDIPSTQPPPAPKGKEARQFLEPGTLLDRYRIERLLGAGGMGEVYLAEHTVLGNKVAVKVLPEERAQDAAARRRFIKAMRVLAHMNPHTNVAAAFDAGEYQGRSYLIMEYVPGMDLQAYVQEHGPLPWEQACGLIRQTALGLEYVHGHAIVHRDLKPLNLMLTPDGTVKILDLGLARRRPADVLGADASHTPDGAVLGTLDYMAPEQARSAGKADARSDLYSLGCTFYYLLAGKAPFADRVGLDKLTAHAHDRCRPIREVRPEVPEAVAAVVEKLLAKKPEDRYASARAVIDALDAAATGTGAGGQAEAPPVRPPRSRRRLIVLGLGLAAVGPAATLLVYFGSSVATTGSKKGAPPRPPLELQLNLSAYKKGNEQRLLSLEEAGVLPLRAGDGLRIEARTTRPAYFYVLNLDATGKVLPMYPWRNNDWDDITKEEPRDFFCIPDPSKGDWAKLTAGPSGMEAVVVLARDTPLTAGERQRLRTLLGVWPKEQGVFDPLRAAVSIGADKVHFADARDQAARGAIHPEDAGVLKDPVLRLQQVLQGDLGSLGVALRGVCYTFQSD